MFLVLGFDLRLIELEGYVGVDNYQVGYDDYVEFGLGYFIFFW